MQNTIITVREDITISTILSIPTIIFQVNLDQQNSPEFFPPTVPEDNL